MSTNLLTTAQAAAALGISARRVQQLITGGLLPAQRIGRDWLIAPADLAAVRDRPGRGWPRGKPRKAKEQP